MKKRNNSRKAYRKMKYIISVIPMLLACLVVQILPFFFPALSHAGPLVIKSSSNAAEDEAGTDGTNLSQSGQEDLGTGESDQGLERLLAAKQQIRQRKVGSYGMVPVYACDVIPGRYEISAASSSPFFKITRAELLVTETGMEARITIPSMSYLYVYPGTGQEAMDAPKEDWLGFEEVDAHTVFTVPVEALNAELDLAAYSKNRQSWYDRKVVFDASSLPKDALRLTLPDYDLIEKAVLAFLPEDLEDAFGTMAAGSQDPPKPAEIAKKDGEYSIEVDMTGGSGRANVSSPTWLFVRQGKGYARLLWSSANYDYMILSGQKYDNLTTDGGNSVFEIPITAFDEPIPVVADTTAMGDPLEIDYTLTFYSDSIGSKGQVPQEAAKKVLLLAAVMISLGAALNYCLKKKRSS